LSLTSILRIIKKTRQLHMQILHSVFRFHSHSELSTLSFQSKFKIKALNFSGLFYVKNYLPEFVLKTDFLHKLNLQKQFSRGVKC